jgi:ATP-dependent DNA helicase PIF1
MFLVLVVLVVLTMMNIRMKQVLSFRPSSIHVRVMGRSRWNHRGTGCYLPKQSRSFSSLVQMSVTFRTSNHENPMPFGEQSTFSIGTKTDPMEFQNTNNLMMHFHNKDKESVTRDPTNEDKIPSQSSQSSTLPSPSTTETTTQDSNQDTSTEKAPKRKKTQLREELRDYRSKQAGDKPTYTVFTNAALDGIYATLPITTEELLQVKGIGPKKVELFGEDILAIVRPYLDGSSIAVSTLPKSTLPVTPSISIESLTPEQRQAAEIILSKERRNVFITGSAGTGKSFLLKYLVHELRKQRLPSGEPLKVAICAPTGVAAIIVGGSTLHSFFGIGLGTGSLSSLLNKVNKNSAAKKRLEETDVLIIDECSMLSSDLLEKLDAIAREIRFDGLFRDEPFGGMQIIKFGDFYQLPPVERLSERGSDNQMRSFCFESQVWSDLGLSENFIVLKQVQRQENVEFITLLNKVRVGEVQGTDIKYLNTKCLISKTNPLPNDGILPTRLYVLNKDVDAENEMRLAEIQSEEIVCRAVDKWRENMPIGTTATTKKKMKESLDMELPPELKLKIGAQVMLTRNKDVESNLVNGSRGIIENFVFDGGFYVPVVRFDNGLVIKVSPVESVRYNPDGGEGCLVRMQIPLKLAWAITIHKSQGSTLSRASLDISSAFEYGQCYVALSRVRSLEGLWLERPVQLRNIMVSPQVTQFFKSKGS